MAAHNETRDALKKHAALNGATVTDGTNSYAINLDTVDLDEKALMDLQRIARAEGHQLRIAKGTSGTGSAATLVVEPRP